MLVSPTKALKLYKVSKPTLYKHMASGMTSFTKSDTGKRQLDIAELDRRYPKRNEQNDHDNRHGVRLYDEKNKTFTNPSTRSSGHEVLRERLKHLEDARDNLEEERRKEREQLIEQIEHLRKTVEEAQNQNKRLTTLITDQSGSQQQKEADRDNKIEALENIVKDMKAQNDDLLAKEKIRQERQAERRFQRERVERAVKERLHAEENKTFWQKLFW